MRHGPFGTTVTEDGARCRPTGLNLRTLQEARVLGRRCPGAQGQQQLRAVARAMAPGAARRRKAPELGRRKRAVSARPVARRRPGRSEAGKRSNYYRERAPVVLATLAVNTRL